MNSKALFGLEQIGEHLGGMSPRSVRRLKEAHSEMPIKKVAGQWGGDSDSLIRWWRSVTAPDFVCQRCGYGLNQ